MENFITVVNLGSTVEVVATPSVQTTFPEGVVVHVVDASALSFAAHFYAYNQEISHAVNALAVQHQCELRDTGLYYILDPELRLEVRCPLSYPKVLQLFKFAPYRKFNTLSEVLNYSKSFKTLYAFNILDILLQSPQFNAEYYHKFAQANLTKMLAAKFNPQLVATWVAVPPEQLTALMTAVAESYPLLRLSRTEVQHAVVTTWAELQAQAPVLPSALITLTPPAASAATVSGATPTSSPVDPTLTTTPKPADPASAKPTESTTTTPKPAVASTTPRPK